MFVDLSRGRNEGPPLFCFPYAGGSANAYQAIAASVRQLMIWAYEMPGRGRRISEAPATSRIKIVEDSARIIASQGHDDFFLFGHSMGGMLAFETARVLQHKYSLSPRRLILSGIRPPSRVATVVAPATDEQLIARIRRLGGTPAEILENEELLQLILPALKADFELVDGWTRPFEPLHCDITTFAGADDRYCSVTDAVQWEEFTDGGFSAHRIAGAHFFIHTEMAEVVRHLDGIGLSSVQK